MAYFHPIRDAADDEFQSSENNDLVNLAEGEFWQLWKEWFRQAQRSNDVSSDELSHSVAA